MKSSVYMAALLLAIAATSPAQDGASEIEADPRPTETPTVQVDQQPVQPAVKSADPNYTPTEEISDDLSVSFPVDI
jgi:hypothetical protein